MPEETMRFRNHYHCDDCDVEWQDDWSCMCNDRCPSCNKEIEPYESEDLAKNSHRIINEAGTEIDYDAAVNLMDDDLRERIHSELAPSTESEFFQAYCAAHREKFGEEFEPNKKNPVL